MASGDSTLARFFPCTAVIIVVDYTLETNAREKEKESEGGTLLRRLGAIYFAVHAFFVSFSPPTFATRRDLVQLRALFSIRDGERYSLARP